MTAIHVIFDGKHFVPKEPVSLPADSEAVVIVTRDDDAARAKLDAEVRAYYQSASDAADDAWARAVAPKSISAWDED
jgi:hypothetical protein